MAQSPEIKLVSIALADNVAHAFGNGSPRQGTATYEVRGAGNGHLVTIVVEINIANDDRDAVLRADEALHAVTHAIHAAAAARAGVQT